MAMNVFGNPITNSTLAGMPEYANKKELKDITREDRATVALNMKNARGNDVNVRQFVENVGKNSGFDITTLCVVYNATGDTLTFVTSHDWNNSHLAESPFPVSIANGQWAGFVHVKPGGESSGSHGAVVYRGKNESGIECDWMISWLNPYNRNYDNKAYTEIREKDHFQGSDTWDKVYNKMKNSGLVTRDTSDKCMSSVSTGSGYKAVYEAIFTLEKA